MWQKKPCRGIFILGSFESNEYLSKINACFIKTKSLTAYRKQTKQLIKIPGHRFLDEGNVAMPLIFSS